VRLDAVRSERLHGRRPGIGDAPLYQELFGDPAVAATLWPPPLGGARSAQQARALLTADIAHWDQAGFGPWVFFEHATDRFVGQGGLERTDAGDQPLVEVAYAVRRHLWGSGFGTEIARAAVRRARDLGLPEVVGFTLTTNTASRRVLENAGLRFERVIDRAGNPHWFGRVALAPAPRAPSGLASRPARVAGA
jgi:[ribosomal protein S5]-alanine N-acetyltransferase